MAEVSNSPAYPLTLSAFDAHGDAGDHEDNSVGHGGQALVGTAQGVAVEAAEAEVRHRLHLAQIAAAAVDRGAPSRAGLPVGAR